MAKKYTPYEQTLGALTCPWCGANGSVHCEGSYVRGYIAFAGCSDILNCGARGPDRRTTAHSNDEHIILEQAVEAWNTVVKRI